jgi:GT2 family glycosyltransferase
MTRSEAAILIVTYNSEPEIAACIEAARRTGAEILVIDNASRDGTVLAVSRLSVSCIANETNRGFAAAVNQGVRATSAPYVLLLNPDAVLETGIESLIEECGQPQTGAAGGQLLSTEGVPQGGFNVRRFPRPVDLALECLLVNRLWPRNRWNWRYRCLGFDSTQRVEVEQPAGALLMFRRDVWQAVGGFDEGFFPLWFEDVDFCRRVRDAGFRIFYLPNVTAMHLGGHAVSRIPLGGKTLYWYRSLLRYSIRHFHPAGRMLTCLSVVAGSALRLVAGGKAHRSPEMLRAYGVVVRLALRSLWVRRVQLNEILF